MTGVEISLLDVKKLAYLLVDGYWQVSVVDEIDSTQTYLTKKNPLHGEVIATEFQSAGRGRLDRTFEANKSLSLLFSFYVQPKRPREDWGWIPLLAGICLEQVLNREEKVFVTKWPNDLLSINSAHDGKVAGILVEVMSEGVVVGIGINVSMNAHELPVPTATSLKLLGIEQLDRNIYLALILKEFANIFQRWEEFEDFSVLYAKNSSTIGNRVEVHGSDAKIQSGLAKGVGSHGELVLDDGSQIYSGDVVHLFR
jgi:BirA family transcriptional regulator, biotin operon repressor / biotin---[acetyl-CoA-carboxylase] ligase